jgi:UDP-N-acetylglucosamine 2-epimerase (non-hydrolysing)
MIEEHNLLDGLKNIEVVGPYGFLDYLRFQYNSYCVISDSGTAQEECPLLEVPVIVPRNATERPESVENGNSILIGETRPVVDMVKDSIHFLNNYKWSSESVKWLGDGATSTKIVDILLEKLP